MVPSDVPSFPGGGGFSLFDGAAAAVCLAAVGVAAWRAPHGRDSDFLTAGRALPWRWAAAGTVASEVSSLTVLGLPAAAYAGGWGYLQFFVGSLAARVVFALAFVPAYYRSEAATAYDFLGRRLGSRTRGAAALLFLALQAVSSSVRLAAAGAAAAWMLGWPVWTTVALMAMLGLWCAASAGLSGSARAGGAQAAIVLLAGVAAVGFAATHVDGGFEAAWICAQTAGRLDIFSGVGAALAAAALGFLSTLAAFCCDFELGQKILSAEDEAQARRAVWASTAATFVVLCVFLAAGSALFAFYRLNTGFAAAARPEQLWPQFSLSALPAGLRGLALAAVLVASCDLPLVSTAAVIFYDLLGRECRAAQARVLMAGSAAALAAAAMILAGRGGLWVAAQLGGVVSGPLFGVVAAAWLRPGERRDGSAAAALAAAVAVNGTLLWLGRRGLPFDWTWLAPIGAALALALERSFAGVSAPRLWFPGSQTPG